MYMYAQLIYKFYINHLSSVCRLAMFVSLQAKVLPHYTFSVWFI